MQAFFNGLSGLFAFSRGLDTVSNNVSNMNTPGYRGSDTFYRSISDGHGQGRGAGIAGTNVRTTPGETRQTGSNTDLAINGAGFFVLRNEQGTFQYTRAGQFQINKDGFLVDAVTGFKVQSIDTAGGLSPINIKDNRILAPIATSNIEFIGSLARSGPADAGHTIQSVQVFDTTGGTQTLSVSFEPLDEPADSWAVSILDANGNPVHTGRVSFGADGSPVAGANTVAFVLTVMGATQTIQLDFGKPGNFSLAHQVSNSINHTLSARVSDGSAAAGLTGFTFDEQGRMKLSYSNGETREGSQIALADLPDEAGLLLGNHALYSAPDTMRPAYGHAATAQFGRINAGYIELSNVDLAQEFGEILIIQRGYQASSRIMTVADKLLEQLYTSTRGG